MVTIEKDRAMTQEESVAAEKVRATGAEFMTVDQLASRMQSGRPPVVVDVLDQESYRSEHISGAINLPVSDIRSLAPRVLPYKDAEIVVYCGSFQCDASMMAAKAMFELGYTHVSVFKGGLKQWEERGLPMEGSQT